MGGGGYFRVVCLYHLYDVEMDLGPESRLCCEK